MPGDRLKTQNRNKVIYIVQLTITIVLIYWFYKQFYSYEFLATISQTIPSYLFLAIIAIIIEIYVRSFRWSIPFSQTNKVSHKNLLGCMFMSYFVSDITPSRAGDAIAIIVLNKIHSINLSVATAVTYLEKVFDLTVLGLSTILSIYLLSDHNLNLGYIMNGTLITILAIFIIPLLIVHDRTLRGLKKFCQFITISSISNESYNTFFNHLHKLSNDFINALRMFSSWKMILNFTVITSIIWIFYCLRFYLIVRSVNIDLFNIPYHLFAVLTIFIFAISVIPVSLGGIGIKEIGAIMIFSTFNIDTNLMAAALIIDRIVSICVHAIVGIPFLMQYMNVLKSNKIGESQ